jgi:hypothetical protein
LDNLGVLDQRSAKTDIQERDVMDGIHPPLGPTPDIHPGMSPPLCPFLRHRHPFALLSPTCAPFQSRVLAKGVPEEGRSSPRSGQ